MAQWIAVSRSEHADKYFWPRQGYGFAADNQVVRTKEGTPTYLTGRKERTPTYLTARGKKGHPLI